MDISVRSTFIGVKWNDIIKLFSHQYGTRFCGVYPNPLSAFVIRFPPLWTVPAATNYYTLANVHHFSLLQLPEESTLS